MFRRPLSAVRVRTRRPPSIHRPRAHTHTRVTSPDTKNANLSAGCRGCAVRWVRSAPLNTPPFARRLRPLTFGRRYSYESWRAGSQARRARSNNARPLARADSSLSSAASISSRSSLIVTVVAVTRRAGQAGVCGAAPTPAVAWTHRRGIGCTAARREECRLSPIEALREQPRSATGDASALGSLEVDIRGAPTVRQRSRR